MLLATDVPQMGQAEGVWVGEGGGRTRDPLEDAKGQPKDPHRSALREERRKKTITDCPKVVGAVKAVHKPISITNCTIPPAVDVECRR